jgi:uncharacterized protein YdeI (YjbR/CyaY-like superfamily)
MIAQRRSVSGILPPEDVLSDVYNVLTPPTLEIAGFSSPEEWARWLAAHHAKSNGVWLRFFKKASGIASITYDEALDEALCYGWIDGQTRKYDDESWLRKFTPRRKKSLWSRRNVGHVARLVKAGKMKAAGSREIEEAQRDGRWNAAYDSPSRATIPGDFLEALSRSAKAHAFFVTLNKANRYSIAWRLQTARKPETRERRLRTILAMLAKGRAFRP